MAVAADARVFAISTPSVNVTLQSNRQGEVPFTVTNVSPNEVQAQAVVRAVNEVPAGWFIVDEAESIAFAPGAVKLLQVRVDPPLGTEAGRYSFRLDMSGTAPTQFVEEGPGCSVDVPASSSGLKAPRGYLATLTGASLGGILWLAMLLGIWIFATPDESDCSSVGDCIGEIFGLIVLLLFLALIGFVLMVVGAAIGIWQALRFKKYLGAKLTALFFAILMVPWTILLSVILNALDVGGTVYAILAPLLFLASRRSSRAPRCC